MIQRDDRTPSLPTAIQVHFKGWSLSHPLGEQPVVLGRDEDCEVQIPNRKVSRRHCRVSRAPGGGWIIEDLGSQGGTRLNGAPLVAPTLLEPGDILELGGAAARLVTLPQPSPDTSSGIGNPSTDLLLQTIKAIYSQDDLSALLRTVVDRSLLLVRGDRGALFLSDSTGALEVAVARDTGGVDLPPNHPLTRTLPRRALETGRPMVLTDIEKPDQKDSTPESVRAQGLRSVICIPLPGPTKHVGVLYVESNRPTEDFMADDLAIFEALAVQVAVAIERTRHLEQAQRQEQQQRREAHAEIDALKAQLGTTSLVGKSPAMNQVFARLERLAATDATVCFVGETGSGKEILARRLHRTGPRKDGPFIVIDCGAIPDNLIESELFGHEKGAFTGAGERRLGRFREAEGGVVFLDEVGELPLELQPKLLRVLQERTVQPVGGSQSQSVDIQVLSATHRDLEAQVSRGLFREDLYYRLAVVNIEVPPLRDRTGDILQLAEHFLQRYVAAFSGSVRGFTREAMEAMQRHRWPGNVRELQNRTQRAVLLSQGLYLTADDMGFTDRGDAGTGEERPFLPLQEARAEASETFERNYLTRALVQTQGNVSQAAELAEVSRQLLQRLLQRHGINRRRFTS